MKSLRFNVLLSFLALQLCACGDDDQDTPPDISIIEGLYDAEIQHDVISNTSGFEEIDTSYLEDFSNTSVTLDGNIVNVSFPKEGRYELPDLAYEVRKVEKFDQIFEITDVHLTLLTTNDYRMEPSPNPAFRILGENHPSNQYKVELELLLRSRQTDSVYTISVRGYK